jgi:hypothetical protein
VGGNELKNQIAQTLGIARGTRSNGSNRVIVRGQPVAERALADAVLTRDFGHRRAGKDRGDGLGAQLARMGSTAGHSRLGISNLDCGQSYGGERERSIRSPEYNREVMRLIKIDEALLAIRVLERPLDLQQFSVGVLAPTS